MGAGCVAEVLRGGVPANPRGVCAERDIGVQHLIKCLDEYIDRGSVKSDFTEVEDVVFTLLQPQIDKRWSVHVVPVRRQRVAARQECNRRRWQREMK